MSQKNMSQKKPPLPPRVFVEVSLHDRGSDSNYEAISALVENTHAAFTKAVLDGLQSEPRTPTPAREENPIYLTQRAKRDFQEATGADVTLKVRITDAASKKPITSFEF